MTDAATLLALAGRVMGLTEGCRETDALIALHCGVGAHRKDMLARYGEAAAVTRLIEAADYVDHCPECERTGPPIVALAHFTSSLDAAMTLRLDWMSIELTESAANDSTSDPRFTRCRIWDWRRGPLAFDRTNEWKAEGNRPLPLNIVWAILHARAAQASSVPAGDGK